MYKYNSQTNVYSFNEFYKITLYYASNTAFSETNTFHALLTEEFPQRDIGTRNLHIDLDTFWLNKKKLRQTNNATRPKL